MWGEYDGGGFWEVVWVRDRRRELREVLCGAIGGEAMEKPHTPKIRRVRHPA